MARIHALLVLLSGHALAARAYRCAFRALVGGGLVETVDNVAYNDNTPLRVSAFGERVQAAIKEFADIESESAMLLAMAKREQDRYGVLQRPSATLLSMVAYMEPEWPCTRHILITVPWKLEEPNWVHYTG